MSGTNTPTDTGSPSASPSPSQSPSPSSSSDTASSSTPSSSDTPTSTSQSSTTTESSSSTPTSTSPTSTSTPPTTSTTPTNSVTQTTPTSTTAGLATNTGSTLNLPNTATNSLTTTTHPPTGGSTIITQTTSNGHVITLTQVLNPTDGSASGSISTFFQNKGAVAGVFVVVGIAVAAMILFGIVWCRRRSRARAFDREVAAAAHAAAASARRKRYDDLDDDKSFGSSRPINKASSSTPHYTTPSMRVQAANNAAAADGAGARSSAAPGVAGFGAGQAFASTVGGAEAADQQLVNTEDPHAAQTYDPSAQQAYDPNAAQQYDPNGQAYDPAAAQNYDYNAYAAQQAQYGYYTAADGQVYSYPPQGAAEATSSGSHAPSLTAASGSASDPSGAHGYYPAQQGQYEMTNLAPEQQAGGENRVPSYYNYESQPVAPSLSGAAGQGQPNYGYDPSKLAPDSSQWGWGAQPQQATHVPGTGVSPQYAQYGYAGGEGMDRPQGVGLGEGRSGSEVGSVHEEYGRSGGGLRVANA